MLKQYQQFIREFGIRTPMYLINPIVVEEEHVYLPQLSMVHYLDVNNDSHFPTRDLYYFNGLSKDKRPFVHVARDLTSKTEVSGIHNKQYNMELTRWIQSSKKNYRVTDLTMLPNKDVNTICLINYNLMKDLYTYRASMLSKYNQHRDLRKTYWSGVKTMLSKNPNANHFVSFDLPNHIPGMKILDNISKLPLQRYIRVVTDNKLNDIINLYYWINQATAASSYLGDITEEESTKITLEFKYKGYCAYLPMSMLRAINKESKLESQLKVNLDKIQRVFVLFLIGIQNNVNNILNGVIENEIQPDQNKASETHIEEDEEVANSDPSSDKSNIILSHTDDTQQTKDYLKRDVNSIANSLDNVEPGKMDATFDTYLDKAEEGSVFDDKIYEDTIYKISKPGSDSQEETPEEVVPIKVNYDEEHLNKLLTDKTSGDIFNEFIEEAVVNKTMTSAEIRGLRKLKENRDSLVSPYDKTKKLDVYNFITKSEKELPKELKAIPIKNNLVEDSLKEEVINNFDRVYIKETMSKDITSCVAKLERSGVVLKDYQIDRVKNSLGVYDVHKLTLKPLDGKESTVYFRLPVIDKEGEFMSGNIRYIQRKQETDVPIRKISPTRVALTSNYSKLFVFRTDRKTFDPYAYIVNFIQQSYINEENNILKVIPGKKKLNNITLPNLYSVLASEFTEVRTDKITLLLNPNDLTRFLKDDVIEDINKKGLFFCGHLPNNHIVVMDNTEKIFDYSDKMTPLGRLEYYLNIDMEKIPKSFTMIKILGDNIPLGVCLSYYLGLDNLIGVTKTEFKVIERNKQYKPTDKELVLKFADFKLILTTDTVDKELLFNGFLYYKDFIKSYNLSDFNLKNIYLNLLEFRDAGLIHIKEMNLLEELFLDPITVDVLKEINEPTDYFRLLLRANDMLKDLQYTDIHDSNLARIRGYDRVPGLMYRALTESIRDYKIKGRRNSKIELDPYKVWNYIVQDSTVKITEDINPILDIKESETVTLSGVDGLNKDATPKMLRRFHENDMGLISEASVDSSDVALNIYMSPYAKLKNTRGIINTESTDHIEEPSKLFSTSVLCAPMSEHDDR